MTDFQRFRERTRDVQDGTERHVYSKQEYVDGAGSIVRVKGTDTEDEEAPVINGGASFNLPQDTNAEVFLLAGGSDTNQKFAVMTLPRDKQRKWAEGTGGVQHPLDPERAVEFGDDGIWLKDGTFFVGHDKGVKITVSGGSLTIECDSLDIKSNSLTHNGVNIGDDHKHTGVEPGSGITGNPVGG